MDNIPQDKIPQNPRIPYGIIQKGKSRLAAIQICYSHDITKEEDIDALILSYMQHYNDAELEEKEVEPDLKFLKKLVRGVQRQVEELDGLIAEHLGEKWAVERLDGVMRALLRVAVFELKEFQKTGLKTVVNEYIMIAKGFFNEQEVGFVNGILDTIGHKLHAK